MEEQGYSLWFYIMLEIGLLWLFGFFGDGGRPAGGV